MESCMECKHHKVIEDPDLSDSFNYDDVAVICTLKENPRYDPTSDHVADRQNHRCVTVMCRPYRVKQESEVPDWCPYLIDEKEVVYNLYTYEGAGLSLGSEGIVLATNLNKAKKLFYICCDIHNLEYKEEDVKFRKKFEIDSQIIHFWNGDY